MTSLTEHPGAGPAGASEVLCVPTELELNRLRQIAPALLAAPRWRSLEVIGLGPVAAAASGARLAALHGAPTLILIGIAGRYDQGPAVGSAADFGAARLDGVGASQGGSGLLLPSQMGLPQWPATATAPAVFEELPLLAPKGAATLLTVCAASKDRDEARRRVERHPGAAAEDMEAFGLALGARSGGASVRVVRGISNEAGDRDHGRWRIDEALEAAAKLLQADGG